MTDSIFEFADKFGIESPFGNWLKIEPKLDLLYLNSEIIIEGTGESQKEYFIISFQYSSNFSNDQVTFSLNSNEITNPLHLSKTPMKVLLNETKTLTIKYNTSSFKDRVAKNKNISFFISAKYADNPRKFDDKTAEFSLIFLSLIAKAPVLETNLYKIGFSLTSYNYPIDVNVQLFHKKKNSESPITGLLKTVSFTKDFEEFSFSVKDTVVLNRIKEDNDSLFFLRVAPVSDDKCFRKSDSIQFPSPCFCNRNFIETELEKIILELRKSENLKSANATIFDSSNCKLKAEDKTIKALCNQLNATFSKYGITKCIHKLHFIAQIYHETDRLHTTLEYNENADYKPYIGRGIMQLTHDKNYKLYTAYYNNDSNTDVDFIKDYSLIATNLYHAVNSGGWFWNQGKTLSKGSTWSPSSTAPSWVKKGNPSFPKTTIKYKYKNEPLVEYGTINFNLIAEKDLVDVISYLVNGGGNGLEERRKYVVTLKTLMKYDSCVNKK